MRCVAVRTMDTLWARYALLALFSVDAAHPHKGLFCTNDFVNNVSCTWNSSSVGPDADCWSSGVKTIWTRKDNTRREERMLRECRLRQQGNSLPGCSFVFDSRTFSRSEVMPTISVRCNGTVVDSITDYEPHSHIKMQPPGVPNVTCSANDTWISWTPGSPVSMFFSFFDFEVQVKQNTKTWREARTFFKQEPELRIPAGQVKGHRQVRVRVKPSNWHGSHWSDWSQSWAGAMDCADASNNQDSTPLIVTGGMFAVCLAAVVMLVLCRSCKTRGLLKGRPVPNPSKYFYTLHSVHGGNLKEWLNPWPVSEAVITAQPCDHISAVEVCEDWDVVASTSPSSSSTSALLHFHGYPSPGSDTSGVVDNSSSSSCFLNMGYFMSSSSSGSARGDANPAYFSYQDDPSLCPALTTCPSYECLKRNLQSPDSGFGVGVDVEGEQDLDDQVPPLLILPLHLPSQICPPSPPPPAPPHPPSVTPTSCDSQQVDVPVTAAGGSSEAWRSAGAMCRSSSMPVEPCKTGYMTLKELQATFSNKSI